MTNDVRVLGIDLSKWQGKLSLSTIQQTEAIKFVCSKATEGSGYIDPNWEHSRDTFGPSSLYFGSYHFFRTDSDPRVQAKHYHRVASAHCQIKPVLDFEKIHLQMSMSQASDLAVQFIEETERLWSNECLLYTYPDFISKLPERLHGFFARRKLWIANYGVSSPRIPAPWSRCVAWQFDGDGGLRLNNGIDCDFNWYLGSLEEFRREMCRTDFGATQPRY